MKTNKKRFTVIYRLCLAAGILSATLAGFHLYIVIEKQQVKDVQQVSTIYSERTENVINSIFHKTDVLAAVVKMNNGDIKEDTFNTVAKLVYEENSGIRGIQYMPGAVVTYSYPLEGNEAVMGKNFLEIPDRKKDVLLAIDTKSIALSGPYELIQGGLGVVARNPIFLTDADGNEYFWGFSAIVLDLPDALNDAQLDSLQDRGYDYELYSVNENGERLVISGNENIDESKAVESTVQVPNHEWTLLISSNKAWQPAVAGIGSACIGYLIVWFFWYILHLMEKERKAVTAKDEFFSNISHDMRTPLNAVLGFTKLAQSDQLTAEDKNAYLAKIESSGNLLLELVNDTLILSKGSNGQLQMHPEPHSLHSLGVSFWSSVEVLAKQKNVNLAVDDHECRDEIVNADGLYIEKIFLNLLTNAIKYTPSGGHVLMTARTERVKTGQVEFYVSIKDDGIGMSDEFKAKMFEPFMQENRPGYESNGTGLGLAIVKQTVDLMNGTIQVNSHLDQGTEFKIHLSLPLAKEECQEQKHEEMETIDLKGRKVLLCEDNALNREIAETLLQNQGVEVVSAVNGREGADLFAESALHEFDAVLMDRRMPVMDGLEATEKIRSMKRADAADMPIIAMTADVFDEDIQECLKAGMNAHVAKPIDPEILFAVLQRYINH